MVFTFVSTFEEVPSRGKMLRQLVVLLTVNFALAAEKMAEEVPLAKVADEKVVQKTGKDIS